MMQNKFLNCKQLIIIAMKVQKISIDTNAVSIIFDPPSYIISYIDLGRRARGSLSSL